MYVHKKVSKIFSEARDDWNYYTDFRFTLKIIVKEKKKEKKRSLQLLTLKVLKGLKASESCFRF